MNILITNDDGIEAEGIRRLAEAAVRFGQVCVAAPDGQRSAAAHSITLRKPIYARRADFPVPGVTAFSLTGTPADCVRTSLGCLVPFTPDVLLSGINNGYNVSFDIAYSATVSAALEGRMHGLHSIALSLRENSPWYAVEEHLDAILEKLLHSPLPDGEIWNVNFPGRPGESCKGILENRRIARFPLVDDVYTAAPQPDGSLLLTNEVVTHTELPEGTDVEAVRSGYVSVSRVRSACFDRGPEE